MAVSLVTARPTSGSPMLRENGVFVPALQAQNLGRAKSIVVAIDRSTSMKGKPLDDAVAAARAFLAAKNRDDRVAVVAFGSDALRLTRFSSATIDAEGALRTLSIDTREGTSLYDAVALAADALASEEPARRVIVLLTDGKDISSTATLNRSIRATRRAGASVYAIGIDGQQFSPRPLRRLAGETGGSYHEAVSSGQLATIYAALARELRRTWRLEYITAARPGEQVRLEATVPGQGKVKASFRIPRSLGEGSPAPDESRGFLPGWLTGSVLAPLLAALVVGLLILLAAVIALRKPEGDWVRERLAAHVGETRPRPGREWRRPNTAGALAELYGVTERTLGRKRTWERLQSLLERADLPLRTAELVCLAGACGFIGFMLALVFQLPALMVVLAFVAATLAPFGFVSLKARKRVRAFEAQLPDLLLTLAASLRAGHSLRQGIQSVAEESEPPASKEFRRVLAEASLGRPVEEALAGMAERLSSKDFEYVVAAVTIQREVGGALAGLLEMVAETVRSRQQFRRKVRALTAMGRLSAYILIALPFVVAGAIMLLNRSYIDPLFHSSAGHKIIVIGLAMMTFGSLVLSKIVSFKG